MTALRNVWPYLLVATIALWLGWTVNGARWSERYTDLVLQHTVASEAAVNNALALQKQRYEAMEGVSDVGEEAIDVVRTNDTAADISVDRLRVELDTVRGRATRELSAAATQRAADRQTIMVLSELYESADGRSRELGRAFDEAHARGLNCEAAFAAACGN